MRDSTLFQRIFACDTSNDRQFNIESNDIGFIVIVCVYIKKDTSKERVLVYGNNREYEMNMQETENDFTLQQYV